MAPCVAERFPGMPALIGTTWRNGSAFFMDSEFPQDYAACVVLQQMLDACGVKPTFLDSHEGTFTDRLVSSAPMPRLQHRPRPPWCWSAGPDGHRVPAAMPMVAGLFPFDLQTQGADRRHVGHLAVVAP